ncbi:hypothetical protein M513_02292 [Trichuris suis]|uniref:RNA-directed DNA polymerase n=1 Tax=Trichuris suis TaxID=68888 RepID=A0A085MHC0_9BILA|nr:hypothetical protein M513_02292 [Trichuris suis]
MEGRLCRWALALQEFDFTIKYRKGINNQNADALSRLVSDCSNHFNAAVQIVAPTISNQELQSAQTADPVISKVISTLLEGAEPQGNEWKRFPLRRFAQLFPRLQLSNGILLVRQTSGIGDEYVVPVIPSTMKGTLMKSCHEAQSAGHLGTNRTLARLRRTAYWIGMDRDVLQFCKKCMVCQRCKLGRPV